MESDALSIYTSLGPRRPQPTQYTNAHLERGLQVVFVALGEELIGVGRGPVLAEVLQVLQVGAEVFLTVTAGACEDELGLQLGGANRYFGQCSSLKMMGNGYCFDTLLKDFIL